MQLLRALITIALACALGACRIVVDAQGQGLAYGQLSRSVYTDGYLFNINRDFHEIFWPLPAPGNSFEKWTQLCNGQYKACDLNLNEDLWGQDEQLPLGMVFKPGYQGPLQLRDFDLYWNSFSRTLKIPASSLDVTGKSPGATVRVFMATLDMQSVIPANLVIDSYQAQLPQGADPNDYWPFISSIDSNGIIASASLQFDLADIAANEELRPHNASSPYADVLVGCVQANDPFHVCTMSALPYLGMASSQPSVNQIMLRTVVSRPWMGQRFAQMLQQLPADMRKLFRGVTAVVIASDIRPSFYSPATGAIYLDPQDLWLTPSERNSINWDPDYRSDYGSAFRFAPYWVYVKGNEEAWRSSYSWPEGSTRSIQDIVAPMGNLLAHELAHANDAMPPADLPLVQPDQRPLDATWLYYDDSASEILYQSQPLYSSTLFDLADVLYSGAPVTSYLLSLTAPEVGTLFAGDTANALYSYTSQYEDVAMLVEEVLTHYYFGADRVVAFLDDPGTPSPGCNEFILRWGERNRVSLAAVRSRAAQVLADILGVSNAQSYFVGLPSMSMLSPGKGLCQYYDLPSEHSDTQGQFISVRDITARQIDRVLHHELLHDGRGWRFHRE